MDRSGFPVSYKNGIPDDLCRHVFGGPFLCKKTNSGENSSAATYDLPFYDEFDAVIQMSLNTLMMMS